MGVAAGKGGGNMAAGRGGLRRSKLKTEMTECPSAAQVLPRGGTVQQQRLTHMKNKLKKHKDEWN